MRSNVSRKARKNSSETFHKLDKGLLFVRLANFWQPGQEICAVPRSELPKQKQIEKHWETNTNLIVFYSIINLDE